MSSIFAASPIAVRQATEEDYGFIRSQSGRLSGVADMVWHDDASISRFQDAYIEAVITKQGDTSQACLLVAEDGNKELLGFAGVERAVDNVTNEECGYLNLLCVVEEAEGKGIGHELLNTAESWVRDAGLRLFVLDVFAANSRGRAFYEARGFAEESLRLVKAVAADGVEEETV